MSLETFELFSKLPIEIRSEIWCAALPQARLVQVRERCTEKYNVEEYNHDLYTPKYVEDLEEEDNPDEEDYSEWWDETAYCLARFSVPVLCKIDPSLQHFRHVWEDLSQDIHRGFQKQLEDYGFSSSKSPPVLPFHLLTDGEHQTNVFDATRRGTFWSSCPIPALLRTCRESRQAMKRCGYELAFGTRSSGPRVWFNFRHDALYLKQNSEDEWLSTSRTLDGGLWNIGQFLPNDLKRVQRLALEFSSGSMHYGLLHPIRLFGHLKQLLLAVNQVTDTRREYGREKSPTFDADHGYTPHVKTPMGVLGCNKSIVTEYTPYVETENDLLGYMGCEAEGISEIYDDNSLLWPPSSLSCYDDLIRRLGDWGAASFATGTNPFETLAKKQQDQQSKIMQDEFRKSGNGWLIPNVKFVHVVSKAVAKAEMAERDLADMMARAHGLAMAISPEAAHISDELEIMYRDR